MPLTPAQATTLNADINANTATIGGVQIKDLPHTTDNAAAVALWYSGFPTPDFFANHSKVLLADIKNSVAWKNYTPTDLPPAANNPSNPTAGETYALSLWQARSLACQGFMFNLQTLLAATGNQPIVDATKATLVSGLKDATNTDMPSGASGAAQKGGWGGVSGVGASLCRKAKIIEKLFANTAGGTGADNTHAATLTYEGDLLADDVRAIWGI